MDPWVVWIVVALVLGVAEIVSGGTLVLLMLAGGATAAGVVSAVTDNDFLPWLTFAGVSVALLAGVRPIARRHVRMPAELRTGADRLIGSEALVLETVTARDGRVKLSGEIWSARSFDGETDFEAGSTVRVLQISGATALVA